VRMLSAIPISHRQVQLVILRLDARRDHADAIASLPILHRRLGESAPGPTPPDGDRSTPHSIM